MIERGSPWPLLEAADIVGIVLRPTVAGCPTGRAVGCRSCATGSATKPAFGRRLRLVVIGDGPYPAAEVAEALDTPLLAALPADAAAAQLLAAGGGRSLQRSRLWRTLGQVADDLASQQNALTPSIGWVGRRGCGWLTFRLVSGGCGVSDSKSGGAGGSSDVNAAADGGVGDGSPAAPHGGGTADGGTVPVDRSAGGAPLAAADVRMLGRSLIAAELADYVTSLVRAGQAAPTVADEDALADAVYAAIFGLGRLQPLIDDPQVENIDVDGHDNVWLSYADGRLEPGPAGR